MTYQQRKNCQIDTLKKTKISIEIELVLIKQQNVIGVFTKIEVCKKHLLAGEKNYHQCTAIRIRLQSSQLELIIKNINLIGKQLQIPAALITVQHNAKVVKDHFGIEEGLMYTVHKATINQLTVDRYSNDQKIGALDVALLTTLYLLLLKLQSHSDVLYQNQNENQLQQFSVFQQLMFQSSYNSKNQKKQPQDEVIKKLQEISHESKKGASAVSSNEVVSQFLVQNKDSSIFYPEEEIALNPHFLKLVFWYDNEWGYLNKMVDLAHHIVSVY